MDENTLKGIVIVWGYRLSSQTDACEMILSKESVDQSLQSLVL